MDAEGPLAMAAYGVYFTVEDENAKWSSTNMLLVAQAVRDVAKRFAETLETSQTASFKEVYGTVFFKWNPNCEQCKDSEGNSGGGYTHGYLQPGELTIEFASLDDDWISARNNVVHELGHGFNARLGTLPQSALYDTQNNSGSLFYRPNFPNRPDPSYPKGSYGRTWGFASYQGQTLWQQNSSGSETEEFADQFLGWTYKMWDTTTIDMAAGTDRANWMNDYMPSWIQNAAGR